MKLEVSPYLLVDTMTDWLVIQITSMNGVQAFRSKTRDKAEAHYEGLKAGGNYHMLALVSGDGACVASEYKPKLADKSWAAEIGKGAYDAPEPAKIKRPEPAKPDDWNTAIQKMVDVQKQETAATLPAGFAPGNYQQPAKPAIPAGFTTGLPGGFKTGK